MDTVLSWPLRRSASAPRLPILRPLSRRPQRWRVAGLPWLCLLWLGLPQPAWPAPYTPASGTDIITPLLRRTDPQQHAVQALRAQLAAAPRDAALAAQLAQRYITLGRSQSDPRHYGHAQAALAPWWDSAAPPVPIRLLRATLLQTAHRYHDALIDLDAITRADPGNAQAWLTRATVLAVTGDHAAATASCARLAAIADELATAACLAGAAGTIEQVAATDRLLGAALARAGQSLSAGKTQTGQVAADSRAHSRHADASGSGKGGPGAADGRMQSGQPAPGGRGPAATVSTDELAWAQTAWAELAQRRGDTAAAEARYRTALATAPGDTYLLAACADFLLAQHRPADALALVLAHARTDALLLRRALALQQLSRPPARHAEAAPPLPGLPQRRDTDSPQRQAQLQQLRADIAELSARFDAALRRGDRVHQREQAIHTLHLLGDVPAALALAQENWSVQKEPADVRILLQAALAARKPAAAAPVLAWIKRTGWADPSIATLANQLGDPA